MALSPGTTWMQPAAGRPPQSASVTPALPRADGCAREVGGGDRARRFAGRAGRSIRRAAGRRANGVRWSGTRHHWLAAAGRQPSQGGDMVMPHVPVDAESQGEAHLQAAGGLTKAGELRHDDVQGIATGRMAALRLECVSSKLGHSGTARDRLTVSSAQPGQSYHFRWPCA